MVFSGRSAAARMRGWAVAVLSVIYQLLLLFLGTGQYIVAAGRLIWIISDRTAPLKPRKPSAFDYQNDGSASTCNAR
jgi:hypothetical protein